MRSFRLRCILAGCQSCTSSHLLLLHPDACTLLRHGSGPLWSSPAVPFLPVHSRSSFLPPLWFPWSCWWCCSRWLPFYIRKLLPHLPCRCMRSFRLCCTLQGRSSCTSSRPLRSRSCCRSWFRSGTGLPWSFLAGLFLPARSRSSFPLHWPCHSWCWWGCSRLLSCYSLLLLSHPHCKYTVCHLRHILADFPTYTPSYRMLWPSSHHILHYHGSGLPWCFPAVPFRPVHSRSCFRWLPSFLL